MQLLLLSNLDLNRFNKWSHGGDLSYKQRKVRRPLVAGKPIHVVFKSSKAIGKHSFYAQKLIVSKLLKDLSKKYFVNIHDFANMGNHLHLKVSFKDLERFQNFLRTFAALCARKITKATKGNKFGKFWDGLVFTRVLKSKLEELGLRSYFEGNHRQKELGYQERLTYLNQWNQFIKRLRLKKKTLASSSA